MTDAQTEPEPADSADSADLPDSAGSADPAGSADKADPADPADPGESADPAHRHADRRSRRGLALLAALVAAGAAGCAVAAALTWWTADFLDPLTGPLTQAASGADCLPELVPVALVAGAGFGAALATWGIVRRMVGLLISAGGLLVAIRSVVAMTGPPGALTAGLIRPADASGAPQLHPGGPVVALIGGLLLVAAGAMVAAGIGMRRRLGARYDAPSARPVDATSTDPDDWWKTLDAGQDPTDPAVSDRPDPGGYHDPSERAT